MHETSASLICKLLDSQRHFFATQTTKDVAFRLTQLKIFKKLILEFEDQLVDALQVDLHKSREEAFLTEISLVLQEINYHIKHLTKWTKPKRVSTPAYMFPSSGQIRYEPRGLALIIAPWNYPFQLLMSPLVGAIAAGCCVMLKPSPHTPSVAAVMEKMIQHSFDKSYITLVQGGKETNQLLFAQRFDLIFFTGSPTLGKIVMRAAAKHLTPVVLELGGKSPCIVDKEANIDFAAKRIAWGKLINAGQTCIAPDYLFAHQDIKDALIAKIKENISTWYGDQPQKSNHYPRIVNQQTIDRLESLMQHGNIVYGGDVNKADRYISPTIIDDVKPDFPVMQEEIFGPVLPIMTFNNINKVIDYINSQEKPLALYYFGKNSNAENTLNKTSSGGACINDTLMHVTNHHLPFGGVGNSGMGKYHGKESFLSFSHARAVVKSPLWLDLPFKYVPFRYFKWIKKLFSNFSF